MSGEEIIEGNRLIALSPFSEEDIKSWLKDIGTPSDKFCLDILRYHSSWDWLMPVVEKISMTNHGNKDGQRYIFNTNRCAKFHLNELDKPIKIRIKGVYITYPMPFIEINSFSELEGTWLAIVEFIKWYNKQKVS